MEGGREGEKVSIGRINTLIRYHDKVYKDEGKRPKEGGGKGGREGGREGRGEGGPADLEEIVRLELTNLKHSAEREGDE
jgi:hypothetical protein